ncbi:hypothetical protein B0H17DRAFT_1212814 [Mycena rosella]|uniref:Uncharacterized protein n=1 Tax=Mycena rosella TaxID=1033263 RepID=A0AAD7CRK0_MYCRO|nr:hypothetical protein B0H17DRAFT_1212814 [Mycena rosella]
MAYSGSYFPSPSSSSYLPSPAAAASGQQPSQSTQRPPLIPAEKRLHRRKITAPRDLDQTTSSSSLIPSSYDNFFSKTTTSCGPFSQNFRPSHSIPELLEERKDQFKAPDFVFEFGSTSTPLRRSRSQSNMSRDIASLPFPVEVSSVSPTPVEDSSISASPYTHIHSPSTTDPSTSFDLGEMMSLLDVVEAETPPMTVSSVAPNPAPSVTPNPLPSVPLTPATSFQLRGSDAEKIRTTLKLLRDARLSPMTLFEEILTNSKYEHHAAWFFGK